MALLALEVAQIMFDVGLRCFFLFAAGVFVVLNGPLWLSVRARVFAGRRQALTWLHRAVSWSSRSVGLVMLATWAWVSTGALKPALLLGLAVAIGLFCLLDGPTWLMARRRIFHRSGEAPAWMGGIAAWLPRLGGAVVLLAGLAGIWAVAS